jgi:hypothetical protein
MQQFFYANIPGDLPLMEVLKTLPSNGKTKVIKYESYEGKNLVLNIDTQHNSKRIKLYPGSKSH